jgi:type III pantothenate kinase
MNIVIDVGNNYIKIGAFSDGKLQWTKTYSRLHDVLQAVQAEKPVHVFISSVRNQTDFSALETVTQVHFLNKQTRLPIDIDYETPHTLGTDRIAAAVGAATLFPGCNNLFFDLGTCLTHGFINTKAVFEGGSISPGVEMRFKALAHFTEKLPLVKAEKEPPLTGKSTSGSIMSGVLNGIQFEIEGFIEAYQNKYTPINVLLTGGNASLFEKRLKEPIFVIAELNLIGLNRILNYNV